jgi:Lar family restriction alleviation protein
MTESKDDGGPTTWQCCNYIHSVDEPCVICGRLVNARVPDEAVCESCGSSSAASRHGMNVCALCLYSKAEVRLMVRKSQPDEAKISELKPCPFCGDDPRRLGDDGDDLHLVECRGCGVRVASSHGAKEAERHWNSRPESEAERVLREYGEARKVVVELASKLVSDKNADEQFGKALKAMEALARKLAGGGE